MSTPRRSQRTKASGAAGKRLRRFADVNGLSASALARLLNVTHPAVLLWWEGEIPTEPYRLAIQTLTSGWADGPILATSWGLTAREKAVAKQLSNVQPFKPEVAA